MAGLGRKVFTRERATVADVQGYLMDQTVMVFASASAANAAITAPSEGMHRYLKDVNRTEVYDGARWLPLARMTGAIVPATTSGGGDVLISHNLGATPTWAHVTLADTAAVGQFGKAVVTVAPTVLSIRIYDSRTGAALAGFATTFSWSAGLL